MARAEGVFTGGVVKLEAGLGTVRHGGGMMKLLSW